MSSIAHRTEIAQWIRTTDDRILDFEHWASNIEYHIENVISNTGIKYRLFIINIWIRNIGIWICIEHENIEYRVFNNDYRIELYIYFSLRCVFDLTLPSIACVRHTESALILISILLWKVQMNPVLAWFFHVTRARWVQHSLQPTYSTLVANFHFSDVSLFAQWVLLPARWTFTLFRPSPQLDYYPWRT